MNVFEENKLLLQGDYGKELLEVGNMYSVPIFWLTQKRKDWTVDNNGTGFVLDTGTRTFFVTAAHVYRSYLERLEQASDVCLQLSDVRIPLEERLISDGTDVGIDVATFDLTDEEISKLRSVILRGSAKRWPPGRPNEQEGIFFTGFPGVTRFETHDSASFGRFSIFTPTSTISDERFCCVFDREYWIQTKGREVPPENFDLGGASGAPALLIEQSAAKIVSWRFAGILFEAARELGEVLMFHHAEVIEADGHVQQPA